MRTVKDILKAAISEALASAKAGQEAPAQAEPTPKQKTSLPPANAAQQPAARSAESGEKEEKLASADIETKDVVSVLNSIRAGRSFKDSAVADPMNAYIDKLSGAEKTALYAFLNGIAEIVTGVVDGQVATDPSDAPADVEMKKKLHDKPAVEQPAQPAQPDQVPQQKAPTRSVKPNVSKPAAKKTSDTELEDTSPPAPVVPRRR